MNAIQANHFVSSPLFLMPSRSTNSLRKSLRFRPILPDKPLDATELFAIRRDQRHFVATGIPRNQHIIGADWTTDSLQRCAYCPSTPAILFFKRHQSDWSRQKRL